VYLRGKQDSASAVQVCLGLAMVPGVSASGARASRAEGGPYGVLPSRSRTRASVALSGLPGVGWWPDEPSRWATHGLVAMSPASLVQGGGGPGEVAWHAPKSLRCLA